MSLDDIAVSEIRSFFDSRPNKVFWPSDLVAIFRRRRKNWGLPRRISSAEFANWLARRTPMRAVELRSSGAPPIIRYAWGQTVSPVTIALSTRREPYLSHGSALWAHGLGGSERRIYVNEEQSEKPKNSGDISQEAIDRVFQNPPRNTKLVYTFDDFVLTIVNGKYTDRLGVETLRLRTGEPFKVTGIERTLIDIAVRPNYAGGVSQVLAAFVAARDRVSVGKLLRTLKSLDYTYPYHQAIGFYLERGGYPRSDLEAFAHPRKRFKFYLCHEISKPVLDARWQVYYPSRLRRLPVQRED